MPEGKRLAILRKLNEFLTREFNAGRTTISIAATVLAAGETDPE